MSDPTPTSEWLRPISERYLGGALGPAPTSVRLAAALCALNAVMSAAMAVIWTSVIVTVLREPRAGVGMTLAISGTLAVGAAVLTVVFAWATVAVPRRGWARTPFVCAVTLALVGAVALYTARGAMVMQSPEHAAAANEITWWLVVITAGALVLAGVLRMRTARAWLAQRRYHSLRRAD